MKLPVALVLSVVFAATPVLARDQKECAGRVLYDFCNDVITGVSPGMSESTRGELITGFVRMLGSKKDLPEYKAASAAAKSEGITRMMGNDEDSADTIIGCAGKGKEQVVRLITFAGEMCTAKGFD